MADKELINQLKSQIEAFQSGSSEMRDMHVSSSTHAKHDVSHRAIKAQDDTTNTPDSQLNAKTAFSKIVALQNASDKSEHTISQRLKRVGFNQDDIDEALDKARSYDIVDDLRFAEVLIRSRISQGKGSAGIERELGNQGIDIYAVPGWPHEYQVDEESEYQRARDFIEAHPSRSKNKREGAYRKLIGKGYSSSVASSVARDWSESLGFR